MHCITGDMVYRLTYSQCISCCHGDRFGDMRLTVGRQVVVMWHALREKKGNFIPDLIGSLLEMTLLKQRGTAVQ